MEESKSNNDTAQCALQPKTETSRYLKAKQERENREQLKDSEIVRLQAQLQGLEQSNKDNEDRVTRLNLEKQTLQEQLDRTTAKNVDLEQTLQKLKRTQRELENLRPESGPTRVGYRHEPFEVLNSTFISIHETLKKICKPAPHVYANETPETLDAEARASLAFLQRNSYRPDTLARPWKRVRKPPTTEELARIAIHAAAAEKRAAEKRLVGIL